MKRWIVEGIRRGVGACDVKVELVEAPDRTKALAQARSTGQLHGFQVCARPAMPGDDPAALEHQLTAAVRGAAQELERLVNQTAEELELELGLAADPHIDEQHR